MTSEPERSRPALLAPFPYRTLVFMIGSVVVLASVLSPTAWLTRHYAHCTAAIRTKWVMLVLFGSLRWPCGRGARRFFRRISSA